MKPKKKRDISILTTISVGAIFILLFLLLVSFYEYNGFKRAGISFSSDDPYIHLNLARSFSEGKGFSLNPPHQTATSSSFLWTLLISTFFIFTSEVVIIVHIFGILLIILSSFIFYFLALSLSKSRIIALLSSGIFLLEWHTIWFAISGMEVSLFILLILSSLLSFEKRGCSIITGILVGLLAITRPEGAIMFFLFLFTSIYKKRLPLGYTISFLLLILPVILFNLIVSGKPLPQTFYAKYLYYHQIMVNPITSYFLDVLKYFFLSPWLIVNYGA
ncbi:MAG: hypothetical protein AB1397_02810 [bacterium]